MSLVDGQPDSEMMPGMTTSPRHATAPSRARGAAWAILIGMGATSITYNVVHAVHGGALNITLALIYGIAPVYAAALLSHVVAEHGGGKVMQAITFLLMLGAMALSIGATAAVVKPAAGVWMQWLFGIVIDGAALVSLRVILDGRSRKAHATAEAEALRAEAAASATAARETAEHRDRLADELAAARAELEAEVQARVSAQKRARSSGQKRRTASPRNKPATAPLKPAVPDDVDTQAEALRILGEDPGISGGELGRRLGKSERYGCMLKNRLAGSVAGPDTNGASEA